jgi:hypothetical protein
MANDVVSRRLRAGEPRERVEVDPPKGVRGSVFIDDDKTDPYNPVAMLSLDFGEAMNITVTVGPPRKNALNRALAIMAAAILDSSAEIRDALAAE